MDHIFLCVPSCGFLGGRLRCSASGHSQVTSFAMHLCSVCCDPTQGMRNRESAFTETMLGAEPCTLPSFNPHNNPGRKYIVISILLRKVRQREG